MSTPADTPLDDRRAAALEEGGEIRVHDRRRFARRRSDHEGPPAAELEAAVAELRVRLGGIQEIHAELAAAREIVAALRGELRTLQAELAAEQVASRRARMQAAWLEGELGRREQRERDLRGALASLTAVLDGAETGSDAAPTARRSRGDVLAREREARARAEAELHEARAELRALRDRERSVAADPAAVAGLQDALAELSWRPVAGAAPIALAEPPEFDLEAAAARLRAQAGPAAPVAAGEPGAAESLPARGLSARSGPWLRDGLLRLAAVDPGHAERLALALVPAQSGLTGRPLSYGLIVTGGGSHRVSVMAQGAAAGRLSEIALDAVVHGRIEALVPLLAGGARSRLPGASIRGRRRLRQLLASRKAPLQIADLALLGHPLPDRELLELALLGAAPQTDLIVDIVSGERRLRVCVGPGHGSVDDPGDEPAPATLIAPAGHLARVLAGIEDARVHGDRAVVERLFAALDGEHA